MLEFLIERDERGRYSIVDFESRLPVEVPARSGVVYNALGLEKKGLARACQGLYQSLPLSPDPIPESDEDGICFWRQEDEKDPVIRRFVDSCEILNTHYQIACRAGFDDSTIRAWLGLIDRLFKT